MSGLSDHSFPNRGRGVFIVTTTTFALTTIFVAARLVSRFAIVRNRTWDDWFIILAWLIAFGLSFSIDWSVSKGLGRHDVDIPQSWLGSLYQAEYAFTILYNPALMATKSSILIFYLRLARNTQKILRIASYVTLGIVNVAGIVLTFLNAFQCDPVNVAYTANFHGQCISIVTLYLCSAPVNIITDLAILVLPIPVLTGMRLPQRQKTVLVLTFALGIFVAVVDVVRIYYLQQASDDQTMLTSQMGLGTEHEFAWNASTALLWSAVEVNVGIICACIPTLKPLIKRILPAMITDPTKSGTDGAGSFDDSKTRNSYEPRIAAAGPPALQPLSPTISSHAVTPRLQPLAQVRPQGNHEHEMGLLDFLTTPGMDPAELETRLAQTRTHATANTTYFGFFDMSRPKPMLKTRGMESFKYCATVTILFFLWGFSYGLLNILNNEIARIAMESTAETIGLTAAYFGAYLLAPLTVGQWVLRHGGFKATFICGLCIYGTGTLMFWPSAVLTSFPGFVISQFVVGFGLAILETAANPFLALCGPSRYAEARLLVAQGVQGTATVLSELLAEHALFRRLTSSPSLIDVQWTYLAVTLFCAILALFFYYMPLPEATDSELRQLAEETSIPQSTTLFSTNLPVIWVTLALAVGAQFLYVAAQESVSVWFGALVDSLSPEYELTLTLDNYSLIAHTTFAAGRFLFAPLCLVIAPRTSLLFILLCCIILTILTMSLQVSGNAISVPVILLFFFEGPIWPIIFALGLRGMRACTKWAASLLTAAASGGAIFPFVVWAVQEDGNRSVQYSFCVVVALFAFACILPAYLNLVPAARAQVKLAPPAEKCEAQVAHERPPNGIQSRLNNFLKRMSGHSSGSGELPVVEHRERRAS